MNHRMNLWSEGRAAPPDRFSTHLFERQPNHFVKPSAIEPARIAEARNGRKKFNVFAKPNEQSRACASRAMARNGRKKSNLNTYHLTLHQWKNCYTR